MEKVIRVISEAGDVASPSRRRPSVSRSGQLGRMMTTAAKHMGTESRHGRMPHDPAAQVADQCIRGSDESPTTSRLAEKPPARCTVETENVSAGTWPLPVGPGPAVAGDRPDQSSIAWRRKRRWSAMRVPVAPFRAVTSRPELQEAPGELGCPAILKTAGAATTAKARSGYAARTGRRRLRRAGRRPMDLVVEAVVPFEREISVVVARGKAGASPAYPVVENEHRMASSTARIGPRGHPVERSGRGPSWRPGTSPKGSGSWASSQSRCFTWQTARSSSTSWRPGRTTRATSPSTPASRPSLNRRFEPSRGWASASAEQLRSRRSCSIFSANT